MNPTSALERTAAAVRHLPQHPTGGPPEPQAPAAEDRAVAEVDAVLHDMAYASVEYQLQALLELAQAEHPDEPLPALRARVLLDRLDDAGRGVLLGDLLAAALTALHTDSLSGTVALRLHAQNRRAVERAEIRTGARAQLTRRCAVPSCWRPVWWHVALYEPGSGRHQVEFIDGRPACDAHADRLCGELHAAHTGRPGRSVHRSLLPGHPDHPETSRIPQDQR